MLLELSVFRSLRVCACLCVRTRTHKYIVNNHFDFLSSEVSSRIK